MPCSTTEHNLTEHDAAVPVQESDPIINEDEGEQATAHTFDLNMAIDEDIDVYAEKAHIVLEENEQEASSDNPGSDHDDIDTTTAQGNTSGSTRRRKYLTNKQRQKIYEALLERCVICLKCT